MKINVKGFTLIELLATIVVIAVVSLIAVPVVISAIEKADLAAFKRSAENIKKISKNYYVSNSMEYGEFGAINFECNNSECMSNLNNIENKNLGASGSMGNGYVKIYDEGDIEFLLSNGKYCAEKNISNDEIKYYKGTCEGIVIDLDKIKINRIETISTTSTITASVDVTAGQSGVSKYEFYIDNKLDATVETTNANYTHTYTKVSEKNHKIKVKVYNGTYGKPNYDESTGMDEKEIDASLLDFGNIKIIPSTTEWASSKTYIISGKTDGASLQYKVISGTTVKQDWIDYNGEIKVDWESTVKTPTYIYARFNDGVNTSDEKTYTEIKIDATAPTVILAKGTVTTNSITVVASATDNESGISGYEFSIDNGSSWKSIQASNTYTFSGLASGTYNIKVRVHNNVDLSTISGALSVSTTSITLPTINIPSGWATSKSVTIDYPNVSIKQYSLDGGSTWNNYTGAITFTTNGSIIARASDGTNTVTSTGNVSGIDTIHPTVSYSVIGGTYNTYQTIRITPSDTNYDYMAVQVYKNEALVYTNKIDAKSTSKTTASYYDVTLDDEGTWTIYTVVYDKAGNKQNQNPNNGKWYYQTYNIDSAKYVLTVKQTGGTPINVNIMIDNVSMSNSSFGPSTIKTFEVKANSAVQIKLAKYTLSDQCVVGEHPKAGKLYGKIYSNPGNIDVDGTSYTTNPYTFTMPKKDITVIVGGQTDGSCTPDAKEACRFSCYTSAISSCENVTPSEAQTSCMNGYTESCYKNC